MPGGLPGREGMLKLRFDWYIRQIKTGMPRFTKTNHTELFPEVLNSPNKNASNEMSECPHDKIRKHVTKQARRNHSVFRRISANFLFRGLLSGPSMARVDIQESDVKIKGTAANCVAIASAVIDFEIPKRWHCTTGCLPYYRSSRLTTRSVRKVNAFCKQALNVLSATRNFKTVDRHMSMFD